MPYEVEQKFAVAEPDALRKQLDALETDWKAPIEQVDRYFRHPARDFGQTDEALRIRSVDDSNCVTYKGPKIDTATKTRREIELPIESGRDGAERFAELLSVLSFSAVLEVRKTRRAGHLQWHDHSVEIALDSVDQLGPFVELETIAEEANLKPAQQIIQSLAKHLGLTQPERRSYLELLLEHVR